MKQREHFGRTRIPTNLKPLQKVNFCTYRKYRPKYISPEPLLDLSDAVVSINISPSNWNKTVHEIANWVSKNLNHPELKNTFIKNNIDGQALVLLEADKFPRMNIKNFELIKELTAAIRNACEVDQDEFKRNISLPVRRPKTLFLIHKAKHTGPTFYYMTPMEFFKLINIIRDETSEERRFYALLNHWNRIPTYSSWHPTLFGENRRINPMTGLTRKQNLHPKPGPYLLKSTAIYNVFC